MNKIEELEQKIEVLKQQEANNLKLLTNIEKIKQNDFQVIERKEEELKDLMLNVSNATKDKKCGIKEVILNSILVPLPILILFLGVFSVIPYVLVPPLFGIFATACIMPTNVLSRITIGFNKYKNAKKLLENDYSNMLQNANIEIKYAYEDSQIHEKNLLEFMRKQLQIKAEINRTEFEYESIIRLSNIHKSISVTLDKVKTEKEDKAYNSHNITEENLQNIIDNKFIQIIFDGKLYNVPLDQYALLNIKQQDDIEIKLQNDCIIRDGKDDEETFKINNALKRAYLNRLSKLNISDEAKEYLKRYDKSMEYNGPISITSIKTMVNELAYIYYLEYTNKYNQMDLVGENLSTVRLDKGLNKTLIKKIK